MTPHKGIGSKRRIVLKKVYLSNYGTYFYCKYLVMILLSVLLSACVSPLADRGSNQNILLSESPNQNGSVQSESGSLVETSQEVIKNLPLQELSKETLAQLITINLATYQQDWALALVHAQPAAITSQDHRLAQLATAIAVKAGDDDATYQMSQLWYKLQPQNKDAQNTALMTQVAVGELGQAQLEFDKLLQEDIDDGIKQITGLLLKQSNVPSAMQIMQTIVEQYPDSLQVLLSATYMASVFKEYDKQAQWLDQALSIDASSETAIKLKINLLEIQNENDERKKVIQSFLESNPRSVEIRLIQAQDFSKQANYKQALSVVEQVLHDDSTNINALTFAGSLATYLQEGDKAKGFYRKALQLDPDNDRIRWALADIEVGRKNYEQAEKLFMQISDDSLWFNAQLQVAEMRYELHGIDSAMRHFQRLSPETNEEYVNYTLARHYLLLDEKQFEEAMGYINEATLTLPNQHQLLYARALVAAELKQLSLAESDLRAILAQHPDHVNALNALGYTLADQTQRYEEAKELILKALSLRPNEGHILDSMGWVLYRQKNYTEAIQYLRKAYAAHNDAEVAAHLGEVLWEAGQRKEAEEIWSQAFINDDSHPVLNETIQRYGFRP